jgi:CelD/BcsL family acetyltransferase involved in cellulose biosynthesis
MSSPEVVDLAEVASFAELRGDWLDLARRREASSYFQTPDWVLAWWETLAARPPTRVAAWRAASGRLEALVALSRGRERLHRRLPFTVPVYANAGSGPGDADHCSWLVSPGSGGAVAAWLAEAIAGSPLLVRSAAPGWDAGALPPGAQEVEAIACPRVALPLGAASGGPSGDFLRQLRRFTRRIGREGVGFEWVPPGQVDERLLASLFELHAQGRPEGGSFGGDQLAFHRRLGELAEAERGPAAVVARRGEEIVGVLYGFWWRDTFAAYQSGWDRAYARHGLGNLLVLHALELAGERGAASFDFLRGREPYKYRFGARDEWDRTWLVPRGTAGALLRVRHAVRTARRSGRPTAAPPASG